MVTKTVNKINEQKRKFPEHPQTQQIVNDVSETTILNADADKMENEEGEFTKVGNKRGKNRKEKKRNIGESEEANDFGFRGVLPKAWMYLYRVLPDVEVSHIQNYLEDKLGKTEEFVIKELKSSIPKKKCFMVGTKLPKV
ncbi:hypothetical protein JTB14_019155 [Gonioctena quinquepunctata]|nr:hypothetical protein JTB14_019155 [Gonioctena quinquepunctata]